MATAGDDEEIQATHSVPEISIPTRRLDSLTGLRFLAALGVLLIHSVKNPSLQTPLTVIPGLQSVSSVGYLGVTFFFVLSGFVLTWSARRDGHVKTFYQKRFARVAPLSVATWLAFFVAIIVAGTHLSAMTSILTLFLLQSWVPHSTVYFGLNGVTWSLSCEVFYYMLHPWILRRMPRSQRGSLIVAGSALGASLIVAIIFMNTTTIFANSQDLWVFPIFGLGAFVAGMGLAEAMKYGLRSPIPLSLALVLAALSYGLLAVLANSGTAIFSTGLPRTLASVIFMPFVGILILAAATTDLGDQEGFLSRNIMVRLGEWSFALYMIHEVLLRAAIQVGGFTPRSGLMINVVVELAFVLASIFVAGLVYWFYEEPLERWLRPANDRVRLAAT